MKFSTISLAKSLVQRYRQPQLSPPPPPPVVHLLRGGGGSIVIESSPSPPYHPGIVCQKNNKNRIHPFPFDQIISHLISLIYYNIGCTSNNKKMSVFVPYLGEPPIKIQTFSPPPPPGYPIQMFDYFCIFLNFRKFCGFPYRLWENQDFGPNVILVFMCKKVCHAVIFCWRS